MSYLQEKLKARAIRALIASQTVLVIRPGKKVICCRVRDLKVGDAFCYDERWYHLGEKFIQELVPPT